MITTLFFVFSAFTAGVLVAVFFGLRDRRGNRALISQIAQGLAQEIDQAIANLNMRATDILKKVATGAFTAGEAMEYRRDLNQSTEKIKKMSLGLTEIIRASQSHGSDEEEREILLRAFIADTVSLCTPGLRENGIELKVEEVPDVAVACPPAKTSLHLLETLAHAIDSVMHEPKKHTRMTFALENGHCRIRVIGADAITAADINLPVVHPSTTAKAS